MHLSSPQVAGSSEFTPELKSQELKIKAVFILNKNKQQNHLTPPAAGADSDDDLTDHGDSAALSGLLCRLSTRDQHRAGLWREPRAAGSTDGFLSEHPLCSAGPRPHLCRGQPAVSGPPTGSASGPGEGGGEGSDHAVAVGFE